MKKNREYRVRVVDKKNKSEDRSYAEQFKTFIVKAPSKKAVRSTSFPNKIIVSIERV